MLAVPNHRTIVHLDLDSFFVSVERIKNPELEQKPVIVGGYGQFGVVSSCSYEARKKGVQSAMPVKKALQLCPEAIVLPGDTKSYSYFSEKVTQIIQANAPLYEKSSIDEFYIDITGMDTFYESKTWAKKLRQTIISETKLPISMGVASNKLVAKVATGEAKPNGELFIDPGHEATFFGPLPVGKIPMIGKKTEQLLHDIGINMVQDIWKTPDALLLKFLGPHGLELKNRSKGIDNSPIHLGESRKSISSETTFDPNQSGDAFFKEILTLLTEKIMFLLRKENKITGCVAVKIRYDNFETHIKQVKINYSGADRDILDHVYQLFYSQYDTNRKLRLVGIRLSDLVFGGHPINLFQDQETHIKLYQAMDAMKLKYGKNIIKRATTMDLNPHLMDDLNLFQG